MVFLTGASIFIDGGLDNNKKQKLKETPDSSETVIEHKDKTEIVVKKNELIKISLILF